MKRKTNKKSGIIAAVVGLSAVSLVSIGFASWVMSGGDTATLGGDIVVDSVDDQRHFIFEKDTTTGKLPVSCINYGKDANNVDANAIVFGANETTTQYNWLTLDDPKYENLTATVTFHVANISDSEADQAKVSVAIAPDTTSSTDGGNEANSTGWYKAKYAGLVGTMTATKTVATDTDEDPTFDENNITFRKVTVSIVFTWGSAFGNGQNPYAYYNNQPYSRETSDDAKTKLSNLNTYLKDVDFVLTITTTA